LTGRVVDDRADRGAPGLTLAPIDASSWQSALTVRVGEDQLPFVAGYQPVALVILAKAYLRIGERRWTPLVIRDAQGAAVGVVALADRDGTCQVAHLAVDEAAQRRGVASEAMPLLVTYAGSVLGCQRLELTVHPDNLVAQALYRRAGFRPTGELRHDEPVWQRGTGPD
jgi:diamine N-acetyltransferase